MSKALLYDATLCIGCKQCEQACAEKNQLPYSQTVDAQHRRPDQGLEFVFLKRNRTGPLPHPASQSGYAMGGRVGERAGTATQ